MKITVDANGQYTDFCYPNPKSGLGLFQSTEGLGFEANPDLLVRPLPKVICLFPGIHPAQLLYWMEDRGADVSWQQGPCYFTHAAQVQEVIRMTELNLSSDRYFMAPIDPNYRYYLEHNKIEYAMVHPDKSMKQAWLRHMRAGNHNSSQDIKDFFSQWDRTIQELENVPTHTLAQRYRVVIRRDAADSDKKSMYVTGVPEYLKPESSRIKMYLNSYHDEYALSHDPIPGSIVDSREPIYQINGQVYGRVKEHDIKLSDVK
jgi:hypothetical protein